MTQTYYYYFYYSYHFTTTCTQLFVIVQEECQVTADLYMNVGRSIFLLQWGAAYQIVEHDPLYYYLLYCHSFT